MCSCHVGAENLAAVLTGWLLVNSRLLSDKNIAQLGLEIKGFCHFREHKFGNLDLSGVDLWQSKAPGQGSSKDLKLFLYV